MYVLTDLNRGFSYYSKVLKPLGIKIGRSTQTLRNRLKSPDHGTKQGFFICEGEQLKSNQGRGNNPDFGLNRN
mgnify:CR=1 FL=1